MPSGDITVRSMEGWWRGVKQKARLGKESIVLLGA